MQQPDLCLAVMNLKNTHFHSNQLLISTCIATE